MVWAGAGAIAWRVRLRSVVGKSALVVLSLSLLGLVGCDLPEGFHDYVVIDGLDRPTNVEFSPDGRIFVAEKSGILKVFSNVDDTTASVVADLRTNVFNSWDRGFLGLALHPDFPADPSIYVSYTYDAVPGGTAPRWGQPGATIDTCPTPPGANENGCVVGARVSRLTLTPGGGATEQVLIEDWCQQFPSHTIGTLAFGADGALYAGAGEGAAFDWADYGQRGNPCGDPAQEGGALRSQDLRTTSDPTGLDGTIIRIDPATGAALPSNPLAGSPDPNARRIVAEGFRNPFRFTVRPGTSELWIGDVGWRTWEEIDRTVGNDAVVDNFGWPCHEGAVRAQGYDVLNLPVCENLYATGGVTAPVYTFRHDEPVAGERCVPDNGSSVSGVAFAPVDGPYPDDYDGALFFADAVRQCIFVMRAGGNGLPDPGRVAWFHQGADTPVELEIGPGGELWYVDLFGGAIHRVGYSSTNAPPQAAVSATPSSGDPPLTVSFDASGSIDTDPGDVLAYAWDLDGDGELDDGTGATATATYDTAGTRTVRVRVTDAVGAADTATTTVQVGTGTPVPEITLPAEGGTVAVGEAVGFSGGATVPGVGQLPPSALSWSLDVLHCPEVDHCHRHPDVFAADGVASGTFNMPDHEYPAAVELHLSATWDGETVTTTRRIDYRTAPVELRADTRFVVIDIGGVSAIAPFTASLPEGTTVTVGAPETVTNHDGTFTFSSWSDGGARVHEIVVPAGGATLAASYVPSG
jgi:glucose/arabinose dehydrogenase